MDQLLVLRHNSHVSREILDGVTVKLDFLHKEKHCHYLGGEEALRWLSSGQGPRPQVA